VRDSIIIIQARSSSTRLPGKVLLPFIEEKTILGIQVENLKNINTEVDIVVATTTNPADDAIVSFCNDHDYAVFRGSENDVLGRFIECAEFYNAQNVARVCSDNPFFIGEHLKSLLDTFKLSDIDYLSFKNVKGTPAIKTHWGVFGEVVSLEALKKVARSTIESFYHEHVTNYIYGNPNVFKVKLIDAPLEIRGRFDLRFTIDTKLDFEMSQVLYPLWDHENLDDLIDKADKNVYIKNAMKQGIDQFSK